MMNREQWLRLMTALGFSDNLETFEELMKIHQSKGRYYHSNEHISACLRHLDGVKDQVQEWEMLALAFWFHDAIYNSFSTTNERDSANWAMNFLKANDGSQSQIKRIEALIMATCHDGQASDPDMQILIDIDLSILGARTEIYDTYEKNIRKEYRRVPRFIFRKKRKEILQGFLIKPRLFGSDYFFDLLEEQARINLKRAIEQL